MIGLHPYKVLGWTQKPWNSVIVEIIAASFLTFDARQAEYTEEST